jgi:two-component system, NtrC family, sensor kinase
LENQHISISISDSGSGIRPEHLARIFDPGFTTKGVGIGTGLGLSISARIIQDHRGSISVKSDWGNGTTFVISLPREGAADPVPAESAAAEKQG